MKILHVVGTRPDFMQIAPIMRALAAHPGVEQSLVHTGQHYDDSLSDHVFADLQIPKPDLNLGVGSGSSCVQTGRIMIALEPVIHRLRPDWVFTVGAVNSALAGALVAAKSEVPVAHLEAGLRSGDRLAPEELNRRLADAVSDLHFTSERAAGENLVREGIDPSRIRFVGALMIDTLDRFRPRAAKLAVHRAMGLPERGYVVATIHRPENVDDPERLSAWLAALGETAAACGLPVVLPLHPRTAGNVRGFGLDRALSSLIVLAPLRYLEFICLMDHAAAVITDSGGVQEESTVLGVPCITLRAATDRPVTVEEGTNLLFDGDPTELPRMAAVRVRAGRTPCRPPLWDGRAAERVAKIVSRELLPRNEPDATEAYDVRAARAG